METTNFLLMQMTAALFTVIAVFVLGAAFGAGVWVAWRGLDRRAGRFKRSIIAESQRTLRQDDP